MRTYLAVCLCTFAAMCHGQQYLPFELPTPAGFDSHVTPLRIGRDGQVVGHVSDTQGHVHAFAWLPRGEHGLDQGLHVIGPCNSSIEVNAGINCWAGSYFPQPNVSHRRAWAWTHTTGHVIIDVLSHGVRNAAGGVSPNGIVVGWSETDGHDTHGAPLVSGFAWDAVHGLRPVMPLDGFTHSVCEWVNHSGTAVGVSFDIVRYDTDPAIDPLDERLTTWAVRSRSAAFIAEVGSPDAVAADFIVARSLDDLIASDRNWRIESIAFIDDRGVVACNGVDRAGGRAGLLLVPRAADLDADDVITDQELASFMTADSNGLLREPAVTAGRYCELDGLLFSIGHWDVDRACIWCAWWNELHLGQWHFMCNDACYGCDGSNPDNLSAPDGARGFHGQDIRNPQFPHGGDGGNGAAGAGGGAGGDGGIGGDGGRGGNGGDAPIGSGLNGGNGGRGGYADAGGTRGGRGGMGGRGDGTGAGGDGGSGGSARTRSSRGVGGNGGDGGLGGSRGDGGRGGSGGTGARGGRGGNGGHGVEFGNGGSGGSGGHGASVDDGWADGGDGGDGGDAGVRGWSGGAGGLGGDGDHSRASAQIGKPGAGGKGGNGKRPGHDGQKGRPRRY